MPNVSSNLLYEYTAIKTDQKPTKKIIRLSVDSFCIALLCQEQILTLKHYGFMSQQMSFAEKINAILAVDEQYNGIDDFIFSYHTYANIQIPQKVYTSQMCLPAMQLLLNEADKYEFIEENVVSFDLVNVSAWEKDLLSTIKEVFPNYKLQSLSSTLLHLLYSLKGNTLLFIDSNKLTILAKKGNNLLGMNTFIFQNETDACYYTLAFLRKMFVNISEVELFLCGNFSHSSPIYTALQRYFPNMQSWQSSQKIFDLEYRYCDILTY